MNASSSLATAKACRDDPSINSNISSNGVTPTVPDDTELPRHSGPRRLIIAVLFIVLCLMRWERELSKLEFDSSLPAALLYDAMMAPALPECTQEASMWSRPAGLTPYKYGTVTTAEEILAFLITKLDEINAPLTINFGTLLREYRNGTSGPCLQPDHADKDFDVAVFPEHFHYLTTFETEIKQKFGWAFRLNDKRRHRLFTTIEPAHPRGEYFQIDIYGFHCSETNDMVFFPWDMVTLEKNAMLPVLMHKRILSRQHNATDSGLNDTTISIDSTAFSYSAPGFSMPYAAPCLLQNIYGADYMTPKSGKTSQAKWGKNNGRPAYYNPKCNHLLTPFEENEYKRQMEFCPGDYIPHPVFG